MSNVLFPKIRGLSWDIKKVPTFSTEIQQSVVGREVRIQNYQSPIWEFSISFEYLLNDPKFRDETGATPMEQLMGFICSRGGQFDDFLLNESDLTQRLEDSVYSGQQIGVGNGTNVNFQIVRNLGGFLESVQEPANQAANIYVNAVLKTPTTDYTISKGMVTFTSAPANGLAVTADFTFLYRVRFDVGTSRSGREGAEFNTMLYNIAECKEIQLVGVKK